MNSEENKIIEKKLSSVDDDFESLFEEEEINIDSQNKKEALDFNDLFEAISEEPEDLIKLESGENLTGSVEEDFEALLADDTFTCTEIESNTNEDQCTKESPNDQSLVTGFSQIFSSDSPLQSLDNPGNISGNTLTQNKPAEDNLAEELAALKQDMFAERQSFQLQIIQQGKEISNLKEEVEKLRNRLSKSETEKNATEERICDLLGKQKVDVSKLSSEKEEDPNLIIQTNNDKIKAQENIINQLKEEINRQRNDKKDLNGTNEEENKYRDTQSKTEDPNQKIISLVHELNDQKEVSEKLKAYVGEVLENVMVTNPQVLERKQSWSK